MSSCSHIRFRPRVPNSRTRSTAPKSSTSVMTSSFGAGLVADVALGVDDRRCVPGRCGAGALIDSTWIWLTIALARASTSSTERSLEVVSTGWMTASAPIQASCRNSSGNAPSWQMARPIRPTSGMSNDHGLATGQRRLERQPGKALAVAGDQLALGREARPRCCRHPRPSAHRWSPGTSHTSFSRRSRRAAAVSGPGIGSARSRRVDGGVKRTALGHQMQLGGDDQAHPRMQVSRRCGPGRRKRSRVAPGSPATGAI